MALHVFDDYEQGASFVVCVVTLPICISATILRFASTKSSRRKIGWEDWYALLALVFYLAYTLMTLWILVTMNGRSVFQLGKLPPATVTRILKVGYAMNPQFSANQTFAKLSLLVLYRRVFGVSRTCTRCIYVLAVAQVLWLGAMYLIRLFMCTPIHKLWNPTTPGTCINSNVLLAAGEAVNSVIDFAMVAVATYMVRTLLMSPSMKWKLTVLFALGGFSGIIGFIKIGEAYGKVGDNIENNIWNVVQMATSIICCCAPIWKSLFPETHIFQRLRSRMRSYGVSSRKSATGEKDLTARARAKPDKTGEARREAAGLEWPLQEDEPSLFEPPMRARGRGGEGEVEGKVGRLEAEQGQGQGQGQGQELWSESEPSLRTLTADHIV